MGSSLFDRISPYVPYMQHTRGDVSRTISERKVKCQGHTGRFKSLLCQLPGFIHISLNHFICSMHTADEGTMYRTPFSGWKVICHPGSFEVFTLSAPCLPNYSSMKRVKYVGIWWLRHAAVIRYLDLFIKLNLTLKGKVNRLPKWQEFQPRYFAPTVQLS